MCFVNNIIFVEFIMQFIITFRHTLVVIEMCRICIVFIVIFNCIERYTVNIIFCKQVNCIFHLYQSFIIHTKMNIYLAFILIAIVIQRFAFIIFDNCIKHSQCIIHFYCIYISMMLRKSILLYNISNGINHIYQLGILFLYNRAVL